jgi:heat-inducible transcriptional repressor
MKKPSEQLDERSKRILRELVSSYCITGHPVGSRTLSKRGKMGLSPATIRNVLADLEEAGYITQPHRSAGRVPTDKGYRFYVNHLIKGPGLNESQKELINNSMPAQVLQFPELLLLTTELLSRLTHNIALAVAPDLEKMTLEHADFIPISERRVLAIMITKGNVVTNKIIELQEPLSQDELTRIGNYIRTEFCGLTLPVIRKKLMDLRKQEQSKYDMLLKKVMYLSQITLENPLEREQLFVTGASQIVNYPEFADAAKTRDVLEALEHKSKIIHILTECIEGEGIHILIGSENKDPELRGLTLISSPYKFNDQSIGTVGILGPTRMEYRRIIPLVDHIAKVVTSYLNEKE